MPAVDRWVTGRALDWLTYASDTRIRLSINISATSLESVNVLQSILLNLDKGGHDPARICFELTEIASICDFKRAKESIDALKARGCAIALDDFGTGASSFSYLQYLDVEYLKIDAGFLNSLRTNPANRVLIKAIVQIANNLNIQTIAEGIEDRFASKVLRDLGVGYGQGYRLGDVFPLHTTCVTTARPASFA